MFPELLELLSLRPQAVLGSNDLELGLAVVLLDAEHQTWCGRVWDDVSGRYI
jgi:hypothetical protein